MGKLMNYFSTILFMQGCGRNLRNYNCQITRIGSPPAAGITIFSKSPFDIVVKKHEEIVNQAVHTFHEKTSRFSIFIKSSATIWLNNILSNLSISVVIDSKKGPER
jgi:TATA-box binding protein (TBP) (component of TFIID and TFIIIB)